MTMPTPLWSLQMEKNSSRAEQYLHQSLQYLRDPQECVRDWTIRFIGESHLGQPLSPPALAQCHIQAPGGPWLLGACWGTAGADRALCPGTIMRHLKNQSEELSALVFRGEWAVRDGRVWGSLQTWELILALFRSQNFRPWRKMGVNSSVAWQLRPA